MTDRPRTFTPSLILFGIAGLLAGSLETWITLKYYPLIPFRGGADRAGYLLFFFFLSGLAGLAYGLVAALIPAVLYRLPRCGRFDGTPRRRALRAVRAAFDWGVLLVAAGGMIAYHRLLVHLDKNPFEKNNLRYLAVWLGLLIVTWVAARLLLGLFPWHRVRPLHAAGMTAFVLLGLGLGYNLRGETAAAGMETASAVEAVSGATTVPLDGDGRPNLLFISIDTLRADHLGVYGYQRNTSPYMDRFARESVLFQQPISQKTMTAPSFATMMTGLYPRTHGLSRNHGVLSDESHTLAERLREQGYRTAAFVSNPACSDVFNFDQGFDFFDLTFYDEDVESKGLNEKFIPYAESLGSEPFLLWLHYTDPHALYQVAEPERSLYIDDPYYGRFRDLEVVIGPRARPNVLPTEAAMDDITDLDWYISQYDAEIRFVDHSVQYAMAAMERMGLLENTLVVLLSDHGESMVENDYYMSHGHNTYNTQAVVPLMIRHPSLPAGMVVPGKVELVDLLPTLLDLLGVPRDGPAMEGRSLVPMMLGDRASRDDGVTYTWIEGKYDYQYSHLAVWGDRWKLVAVPLKMAYPLNRMVGLQVRFWLGAPVANSYRTKIMLYELYDMQADPGETKDLAGTGLEAEAQERHRLFHWLDEHPVQLPQRFLTKEELQPDVVDQLRALGYIGS